MGALGAIASRSLIESGSHVPGIDPADFALKPWSALRLEVPAAPLEPAVAGYFVYDSLPSPDASPCDMMLPGAPAMRFNLAGHDMALALGEQRPAPVPRAAFYGPTSRAALLEHRSGVTVGINLTPVGIARLLSRDLADYRDRVVALDTLLAPDIVSDLTAALTASDQGPAVKAILDAALLPLLTTPHKREAAIAQVAAMLVDPETGSLTEAGAQIGIHPRTIARLCERFFGFPPKLLLRRARLLRSMAAIIIAGRPWDLSLIDLAYHDHSHFTRDAHRFLGMSARRFLGQPIVALETVLRARALVHGTASPALEAQRRR